MPDGPRVTSPFNATLAEPWENSMGMRFVPVPGTDVLFCMWPTRVQDYAAFVNATIRDWLKPNFTQEANHPVVLVSWDDAKAFCAWLTEQERRAGRIPAHATYRLPTDWEWSVAVGLNEVRSGTPFEKNSKTKGIFPWGAQWPPPAGAGNYAPSLNVDAYPNTSPVGSFAGNSLGLYDLGGNVWEWCEDWYHGDQKYRVLRGASWGNYIPDSLLSSYRIAYTSDSRDDVIGFRCVLVDDSTR